MNKRTLTYIWLLTFILLFLIPTVLKNLYIIHLMNGVMIYISLTLAFSILAKTGQVSIGQAAFFGAGAYAAAIVNKYIGFNPLLEFIFAAFICLIFSLIIGSITLRLKGIYFSIATLSFAQTLLVIANMERKILGGATGISVRPFFNNNIYYNYYFSIILCLVILIASYIINNLKLGYASVVIRNDERLARSIGINPVKYKILAFLISAVLTGIIGSYYIHYVTFIIPDEIFSTNISVSILAMAIFGGINTVEGPFLGAFILKIIEELLRLNIKYGHLIIYGLILIISILYIPEGIINVKYFSLKKKRRQ